METLKVKLQVQFMTIYEDFLVYIYEYWKAEIL
jgi:hypothetical protein